MPFERSYIFLDTSVYVQEAYRFSGTSLGKLACMSSDNELRLVVPEIIRQEVAYRLREVAEEHAAKIQASLGSSIVGLITDKDKKLFGLDIELDKVKLVDKIAETWANFCTRCHTEHIPLSTIDLPSVVTSYFDSKPPFGKGRKRNEFPDAFAVASMLNFATERRDRPIYVVSADKGMLDAFSNDPRFRCHKELSEVLDEYNRHTEALSHAAHELMEKNVDWIADIISDQIRATPSLYGYEYPNDRIHIESVSTDVDEMNLVEIGLNRAVFDVGVSYRVEAEAYDLVRARYDDYDWEFMPRRFSGSITAYLEILTNSDFSELKEIASVDF